MGSRLLGAVMGLMEGDCVGDLASASASSSIANSISRADDLPFNSGVSGLGILDDFLRAFCSVGEDENSSP